MDLREAMRASRLLVAILLISTVLVLGSSTANATSFKNCAALNRVYVDGIAINFSVVGTSQAKIDRKLYLKNQKLDRDRDGLVCENEYQQSVGLTPSTTTTTLPPKTRTTPVSDLPQFLSQYGGSLVTITCDGGQGSGVSVPFGSSGWIADLGAQSLIVTNMHVVLDCIYSATNYRSNAVTILHQGTEYVGYVSSWPSVIDYRSGAKPDLAAVITTGKIPQTSYWNVRTPRLGDAVVAIGSAGGIPNTTTRGEIAAATDKVIATTAPAGHGSSGGALFNNDGQLTGFIYAGNGTLVQVVPIPRLCEVVFSCATPITYKD